MKTTLDTFADELAILCQKYNYVVESVREEIETDVRFVHAVGVVSSPLVSGMRTVSLNVRALRTQTNDEKSVRGPQWDVGKN